MAIKSGKEYIDSLKELDPVIYLGDGKVKLLENPSTMTVVKANAKVYDMALDPRYESTMAAYSPLIDGKVSRCNHLYRKAEDLLKRAEMALLTSQVLGTCNYRCPGCDAMTALASVTYEMDRDLGTSYNRRFYDFLKYVQENDLACSGALTDVKGDRSKRPLDQDLDMYVRVVKTDDDGIVVRGCKINQSGAIASHETIVFPTTSFKKGEEDYALAFAVKNGTKGLTYISQYTPFTAERALADDIYELGNPEYGVRETSMVVFGRCLHTVGEGLHVR
jgi:4-hydroxybutyryl-CoA dehydratase/vinylacetyl-CoA-Delta-isomerase